MHQHLRLCSRSARGARQRALSTALPKTTTGALIGALIGVLAGALTGVLATGCGSVTPQSTFQFGEQRFELPQNGLRVVVLPDETTDLVEVDVRYRIGASADPPGKAGLAHFVEHLMFMQRPEGTDGPPLMHYMERVTTFFNAFTNMDSTHYMSLGRKENLKNFLQLDAMRMFYGCKTIPEPEFLRERDVVRNEIRQRTGTPEGQIRQLITSSVYPKSHVYGRTTGGDDRSLSSITLRDACAFIDRYYVPGNATVIVAGNTSAEEVHGLVQQFFGNIPRKPANSGPVATPLTIQKKRVKFKVDVERPHLYVAWALPPIGTADGEVANYAVGAITSRISNFARRWDFATRVWAERLGGQKAPIFAVGMELRSEGKREQALSFMWKLAKSAHRGMGSTSIEGDSFFNASKIQSRARFIKGLESLTSRTVQLGEFAQFYGQLGWQTSKEQLWERRFRSINDITQDQIADVVQRVLNSKRAVIIDIEASETGIRGDRRVEGGFSGTHERTKTAVEPAEAKRPFALPAPTDRFAGATRFTLNNGLEVILLKSSLMPIVSARLVFKTGWAHEPDSRAGLASIASRMLSFRTRDIEQMMLVSRSSEVNAHHTVFTAWALDSYMEPMLKNLERRITAGDYSQRGIEDWQRSMKFRLSSQRVRTQLAAARELDVALFGADHPYTVRGTPTETTVKKVERDAAMSFKNARYTARNGTLILTGQFDPVAAEKLVRRYFGDVRKGKPEKLPDLTPRPAEGPQYIGIVTDKRPQMTVTIAYPGPAGIDAGQATRLILTELINIRLADVRQKLGASYGVYSRWQPSIGPTRYTMGGDVDIRRAGEALSAMRAGIAEVRTGYEGFEADFVHARRKVIQRLLGQTSASEAVARRLDVLARYDLPTDHDNKLLRRVAVTRPIQVAALAQKELRPDREVIVCTADRDTLSQVFAQAGLEGARLVEPK